MQSVQLNPNAAAIAESELVLNPDGSVYHIKLQPEHIANDIIVVGDQGRVQRISSHFDHIECKIANREFVTHTGTYKGKRVTALSTGIGTDNIDIVINELDALVNIDLATRRHKTEHQSLNIVRLGTSGSLQEDIPVDSFVVSEYGLGFDGLLHFYDGTFDADEEALQKAFIDQLEWGNVLNTPYFVRSSNALMEKIGEGMMKGITATANGFYGPQGRVLRLPVKYQSLNEKLRDFSYNGHRITNFEMETSGLYGLGSMLGHNTCTVCAIIANRYKREYSKDYHVAVDELIDLVLDRLTS